MKVHRDGKKVDFSEVMADWIVQHAGFGRDGYESFVMADAATVLAIMRAMVANRHLYEMLIKFAVRYRNSMDKVSVQDVQDAINLLTVKSTQES